MSSNRLAHHLLTQSDEYALRAMTYIAVAGGRLVSSGEIAEATDIPTHYVSKVLRRLVVANLLASTKGRTGGFTLTLPPNCVRFLDILMATDFDPNITHCAFGWPRCDPANPCPLHPAYSELKRLYLEWASSTTLADAVAASRDGLAGPAPEEG